MPSTPTNMADPDDEPTKREAYFNEQRASLRSDISKTSSHPRSSPRPHSLSRPDGTYPNSSRTEIDTQPGSSRHLSAVVASRREKEKRRRSHRTSALEKEYASGPEHNNAHDSFNLAPWSDVDMVSTPPLDDQHRLNNQRNVSNSTQASRPPPTPRLPSAGRQVGLQRRPSIGAAAEAGITALPAVAGRTEEEENQAEQYISSKRTPKAQQASVLATKLYTVSFLIFFAIWGTLARLGLQALTFYSGAPVVFSELWANVAGTFIMGFLAEDMQLFRDEWGARGGQSLPVEEGEPVNHPPEFKRSKASHGKIKKTIPLYVGLTTGFCGSFTSFSSFIRDVFLALSNDLRSPIDHPYTGSPPSPTTTVPRNAGYSVMAILAVILITLSLCYAALKVGAHLAAFLDSTMPSMPFYFTRKFIDPLFVLLGFGSWIGAVLLSIFPPHNAWRGEALFACVFAPVGCLLRYYVSLAFNPSVPSFPMGTFAVNILGTAVLGMSYNLQRVRIGDVVGGSLAGCQVLQGIEDGFCGALTTVSTWILEIDTLKRSHSYVYGSVSVVAATSLLVVVMGSVRWSVGWEAITCVT
jgi:CrcB protein